ncbi:EcsC protein family protein [Geodermatophilus obscurus]|uniref:EcsC protein family protein n=1 Tax=Geodermatophilus obscurus TaxID=1861 RepID=A0A1M7S230_9ACTN|nr:EcsC family protein [Geodermatophilus obscurus]SHN52531.1 EcsC protein family protein [Geodermatophilus obscurus]
MQLIRRSEVVEDRTAEQPVGEVVPAEDNRKVAELAEKLVTNILSVGVDGAGRFKGAREIAEEHRAHHVDVEVAVAKVIATHARVVTATGFATGLGGIALLPVAIPTDVATFYAYAGRCAAAVAHLRGYDIESDEVRSVVLLSLLGAGGVAAASKAGVELGTKTAMAALKKLPGKALIEINKKVGFRLITKTGTKGVVNLGKLVPFVGGGVGATVNAVGMRTVATYAKSNFPTI